MASSIRSGRGVSRSQAASLGGNVAGLFIPFFTGGGKVVSKIFFAADKGADGAKNAKRVENQADVVEEANEAAKSGKRRGSRIDSAGDASDQFEQIESAQRKSRGSDEGGSLIESIEKSRQRDRDARKRIKSLQDAEEDFP